MVKLIIIVFFLVQHLYGQSLDSLKLKKEDLPNGYSLTSELKCKSIQACSFYNSSTIYNSILGKVKYKTIQNFKGKSDDGTIMYFEYETKFEGEEFLKGLLWGESSKPTKEHPEEYLIRDNILIVWSFKPTSVLKKLSQEKIKAVK